jgi:uncharacterized membrane protein (Fun14 family)
MTLQLPPIWLGALVHASEGAIHTTVRASGLRVGQTGWGGFTTGWALATAALILQLVIGVENLDLQPHGAEDEGIIKICF